MSDSPTDGPSADLDGLGIPPGADMGSLFAQAQEMASRLMEERAEAEDTIVEGVAGGGVVKVEVTGGYEFVSVTIDPQAVDPDDITLLEDLMVTALNDAMDEVAALHAEGMGGLDLGSFGGLLGGGS